MITNLRLEEATDSSGVLQSLLGVLPYLCFVYVVLLGKFTELNVVGNKSDNTVNSHSNNQTTVQSVQQSVQQ